MTDDDNCKLNNGNFEKLMGFFLFCQIQRIGVRIMELIEVEIRPEVREQCNNQRGDWNNEIIRNSEYRG